MTNARDCVPTTHCRIFFITPPKFSNSELNPQSLATTDLFSDPSTWPFPECHVLGVLHIGVWLLSLSILHLKCICVAVCINSCFFTLSSVLQYEYEWTAVYLSIQQLEDMWAVVLFWVIREHSHTGFREITFSYLWGKHLGVEGMGHKGRGYLTS